VAKILLIDDDADLAHFLRDELGAHGHEAHWVERAEEGLAMLAAARPSGRCFSTIICPEYPESTFWKPCKGAACGCRSS
jgi:DNA-binding NtrC family response regulator